jgi:hypothetical protein
VEDLIQRIIARVGVGDETARQAVSVMLNFLAREGPQDKVQELARRIPGAEAYMATGEQGQAATLGGMGGMMGGGLMEVAGRLQGLGLGMGEIQGVAQETLAFARERAGADLVNDIVRSIPGLGQFV